MINIASALTRGGLLPDGKTIRSFQAKLLVLDPLQAFMPSNADMQNASHVVFGIPLARHSLTIAVHCSQRTLCVILSIT
nr:hypothetical protein [uncultured Anaerobutyricum sp.]